MICKRLYQQKISLLNCYDANIEIVSVTIEIVYKQNSFIKVQLLHGYVLILMNVRNFFNLHKIMFQKLKEF